MGWSDFTTWTVDACARPRIGFRSRAIRGIAMQNFELLPFFDKWHAPTIDSTSVDDYRIQVQHFYSYFAEQSSETPRISDLGVMHITGAMNWQASRTWRGRPISPRDGRQGSPCDVRSVESRLVDAPVTRVGRAARKDQEALEPQARADGLVVRGIRTDSRRRDVARRIAPLSSGRRSVRVVRVVSSSVAAGLQQRPASLVDDGDPVGLARSRRGDLDDPARPSERRRRNERPTS